MKPVRGGRPPSERRMNGARLVMGGALAQVVARVLMLVESEDLNVRNAAEVMII